MIFFIIMGTTSVSKIYDDKLIYQYWFMAHDFGNKSERALETTMQWDENYAHIHLKLSCFTFIHFLVFPKLFPSLFSMF